MATVWGEFNHCGYVWLLARRVRNLGRDDRLLSDHGKEVRFPYLDEGVMSCLGAMPLWHLADLRLPDGVGDKRIIRTVSRLLGLSGTPISFSISIFRSGTDDSSDHVLFVVR